MTSTADLLPDSVPLPRDLLARVSKMRRKNDQREQEILKLALEWAYANPALPGQDAWEPAALPLWIHPVTDADLEAIDPADFEWHGIPAVRWDAPAAFAAANGMSTHQGKAFIRDALVLVHRLPGMFTAVMAGRVTVWRARKIAQAVLGERNDVCAYVNDELVERLQGRESIGSVVVERLVDEAMLQLHAEERELDQIEALDRRYVNVDAESINHSGVVKVDAAADWADAAPFDETLTALAQAIKDLPDYEHESLDVRRSIALGILADPARAQAILDGRVDTAPTRRRELVADLHLTEGLLLLGDAVVSDADLKAHLSQVIQQWIGRQDIALTIKGIRHCGGADGGCVDCPARIDCDAHSRHAVADYVPSELDKRIVRLAAPRCVHPQCTRRARSCDIDHIRPFDPDRGPTCPRCNLAPLCRHHHRLKTLAGWRYWKLDPTTYLWVDPHGLMYLRERDGTRQLG